MASILRRVRADRRTADVGARILIDPAPHAGKTYDLTGKLTTYGAFAEVFSSVLGRLPGQRSYRRQFFGGLIGLSGAAYTVIVARRVRVQTAYPPVFEDWLLHVLLPLVAYAALVLSASAARAYTSEVLFVVGAATLLLLFIGIHNAWDSILYHVFVRRRDTKGEQDRDETTGRGQR